MEIPEAIGMVDNVIFQLSFFPGKLSVFAIRATPIGVAIRGVIPITAKMAP